MNVIGIDPSITCTAMVINNKKFVYAGSHIATNKKGSLNKWFKAVNDNNVTVRLFEQGEYGNFSSSEIGKFAEYDKITDSIIEDIFLNIDPKKEILVGIEGYSYSANAGPLIDLVSFGTILRSKLYKDITHHIEIIPPSTLKIESAKMTYQPENIGKKKDKFVWRNHQGVPGGSFKKPDMYRALIENEMLNCDWVNYLREEKDVMLKLKHIPKPIEDINDAKLIYEFLLK